MSTPSPLNPLDLTGCDLRKRHFAAIQDPLAYLGIPQLSAVVSHLGRITFIPCGFGAAVRDPSLTSSAT